MSDATVEELVKEAKKPGTFSIIAALKDRAYPSDEVNVYLNEEVAYKASLVKEKIEALNLEDSKSGFDLSEEKKSELDGAKSELASLMEGLEKSKYVFTIVGISEGKRDETFTTAAEKYPIEFSEEKNAFSGEVTRTETENAERDRYFTNLIWQQHITKIVDTDGDIQDSLTYEDVIALRGSLPITAQGKINQAIEKVRNATAVFMYTVDEDFLVKS